MQNLSVNEVKQLSQNSSILTQSQIAKRALHEQEVANARGRLEPTMDQRLKETMDNLTSQIALLTQAVIALTAAIKENTEAMGGEEEEVVQTGGFLGDTTEDDAPAPHL